MCGLLFEYDVRLSLKLYFAKSYMNIRTKQQRVSIQNSIDTLCSYIQQMNILALIMYSFAINSKTVSQSKNFNWLFVLKLLKKIEYKIW